MIYVPKEKADAARRLADFESCGNIHKSGSVVGMRNRYGWRKGGQVCLGRFIYNIGPSAVEKLRNARLIRG